MENLVNMVIDFFGGVSKELVVFIISMLPLLELRGGILAASILGVDVLPGFLISIIGNMIPVPFILWLITPIFNYLKKTKLFSKLVLKIENKALSKKDSIEKYQFWGLVIFVGIPLPGTGAWTGSLIAALLNMDKKKSILAIFLGMLMASIIMLIVSYGIVKSII